MSGFQQKGTTTIVPPSTAPLLVPSTVASGPAAGTIPQPGAMNIISHSWASGQGMAWNMRAKSSWVSKLAGMLGMSDDFDIIELASPGQALSGTGSYYGSGWDAVLQWIVPPATTGTLDQTAYSNPPYPTRSAELTCIMHGVNDIPQGTLTNWSTNGIQAWKNALTTTISRALAGAVYTAGDATITTSGFTLNASLSTGVSGAGVQASATAGQTQTATANGSTLTITLPPSWPGGELAVCFQTGATGAAPVYGINFSGSASFATGSMDLSAVNQSYVGSVPCVKVTRFSTLASDAGKTLICTVNITSGTPTVTFDSYWREADVQGVVLVANLPRYNYTSLYSGVTPVATTGTAATLNAATQSVIALFGSNVAYVDVDTLLWNRSGVFTSAVTSAGQTTFLVTTNGPDFPYLPQFALSVCQSTGAAGVAPENVWVTQVALASNPGVQITGPVAAGTQLSLTVTRAANGTTAIASISAGQVVSDATWFQNVSNTSIATTSNLWDNLHMNEVGYSQIANAFWQTWLSTQTALGGAPGGSSFTSVALKSKKAPVMQAGTGGATGSYWYPPDNGTLTTIAPTFQQVYAIPFYVWTPTIITAAGVEVTTAGGTGSVVRLGIWETSNQGTWPQNTLVADLGTFVGTVVGATSSQGVTCWVRLLPGWYWVGCCPQVGTSPTLRAFTSSGWPYLCSAPGTGLLAAGGARPSGFLGAATSGFATVTGTFVGSLPWSATGAPQVTNVTSPPRIWLQMNTPRNDNL